MMTPALGLTASVNTWLGHAWKAVLSLPADGKGGAEIQAA